MPTASSSTPSAPMPTPVPQFNNPFVVQPSRFCEENAVDITHRSNFSTISDAEVEDRRFSAVPFSPNMPPPPVANQRNTQTQYSPRTRAYDLEPPRGEDRRRSDETLKGYAPQDQHIKSDNDDFYGTPTQSNLREMKSTPPRPYNREPASRPPRSNDKPRSSSPQTDIENPSTTYDVNARNNSGMPRVDHTNMHSGFFNHVKGTLQHWTRDSDQELLDTARNSRVPSLSNSRRNSWSGVQSSQQLQEKQAGSGAKEGRDRSKSLSHPEGRQDNFERSMAFNDDVDETYLLDDDGNHRSVREAVFHNPRLRLAPHSNHTPDTSIEKGGRKTYSERRKREKHRIKHCAERKFLSFCNFFTFLHLFCSDGGIPKIHFNFRQSPLDIRLTLTPHRSPAQLPRQSLRNGSAIPTYSWDNPNLLRQP